MAPYIAVSCIAFAPVPFWLALELIHLVFKKRKQMPVYIPKKQTLIDEQIAHFYNRRASGK